MNRLLAVTIVLGSLGGAHAANPPPTDKEYTVDGVARKALVSIPATATKSDTPVVFAFHGHGGTAAQASRSFGYHTLWPEAIVVYMQGLNTPGRLTDPEGKKPGWQSGPGDQKDRDLKFFDAVLASLRSDYKVDAKRIYSTGHSNGGGFTYLLWGSRGELFAAMAPSAAIPSRDGKELAPKPVIHVAGENDPLVKYLWQKATMDKLRKLDGCDAEGKEWARSGKLTATQYASSKGTPVVTAIHTGEHKFPEEAPAMIVRFFKEHPAK